MSDSKLTALTQNTAPLSTDIAYMVDDPAGSALSQKVTFDDMGKALNSSNIPNTPAGGISATNVQGAINELDTEKAALSGANFTGATTVSVSGATDALDLTQSGSGVALNVKNAGTGNLIEVDGTALVVPSSGTITTDRAFSAASATISGDLTVDTTTLVVDSTNNFVGIGTATPSDCLHVESTENQLARFISTNGNGRIRISDASDDLFVGTASGVAFFGPETSATGNNIQMDLSTGDTSIAGDLTVDTDTLYVDSTNNRVGIGTDSPNGKLDVAGEVRIYPTSGTATLRFGEGAVEKGKLAVDNTSNMIFETAGSEKVRIDSSGNVGIGTTSPAYKLDIRNTATNALGVFRDLDVTSVGAAGTNIDLGALNGTTATAGAQITGVLNNPATTGYLAFNTLNTTMGEKVRIQADGSVGIGTTSPNELLTVDGVMSVEEQASAPGATAGYGKYYAKTDGNAYFQNDAGTEFQLNGGGGGGVTDLAKANVGSNQAISASSSTLINLDTEVYDTDSNYDTVNKKYVVPSDGKYEVSFNMRIQSYSADNTYTFTLTKNGTGVAFSYLSTNSATPGNASTSLTTTLDASTNDEISMLAFSTTTFNIVAGESSSYITIKKIA